MNARILKALQKIFEHVILLYNQSLHEEVISFSFVTAKSMTVIIKQTLEVKYQWSRSRLERVPLRHILGILLTMLMGSTGPMLLI